MQQSVELGHLIPGFTPKPATATITSVGSLGEQDPNFNGGPPIAGTAAMR